VGAHRDAEVAHNLYGQDFRSQHDAGASYAFQTVKIERRITIISRRPDLQSDIHLTVYNAYDIYQHMNIDPKELFSALAHDTRLRCLILLMQHQELCVCELTHAIGAVQPRISRHLAQLRELGLVSDRREGLWIYYRIHPQLPEWVIAVLQATVEGVKSQSPFATDERTLSVMPNRPGAARCA
jgi:ArsR family transcriptional regulator